MTATNIFKIDLSHSLRTCTSEHLVINTRLHLLLNKFYFSFWKLTHDPILIRNMTNIFIFNNLYSFTSLSPFTKNRFNSL